VPPRALRADCPPWLQEVVLRCLEVSPDKRYQSAAQLMLDLQNPRQVPLTQRAQRTARGSTLHAVKRWFGALGTEPTAAGATAQVSRSPIVMAAVDVDASSEALREALRHAVLKLLQTEPGARLACVGVMKTARIGLDDRVDEQGRSVHLKQLVALKHWAHAIGQAARLGDGRLTFHVLEAPDAAAALVEFAQRNEVDHVVIGARGSSALRRYLGSVSSRVVAECPCTVTVVRAGG